MLSKEIRPMPTHQTQVQLGARIPVSLKQGLSRYCISHGIKISYFVAQTLREKLLEAAEDSRDLAIAKERLKNAEFVPYAAAAKSLRKRGLKT